LRYLLYICYKGLAKLCLVRASVLVCLTSLIRLKCLKACRFQGVLRVLSGTPVTSIFFISFLNSIPFYTTYFKAFILNFLNSYPFKLSSLFIIVSYLVIYSDYSVYSPSNISRSPPILLKLLTLFIYTKSTLIHKQLSSTLTKSSISVSS